MPIQFKGVSSEVVTGEVVGGDSWEIVGGGVGVDGRAGRRGIGVAELVPGCPTGDDSPGGFGSPAGDWPPG